MTTVEILSVLGCGGLFVLLGWLTRDRPSSLLLRPDPRAAEDESETEAGGCASCAHPCVMPEQDDA